MSETYIAQQGFETVYHPFQHDIPDTREGFDISGSYHVIDPFLQERNRFYTAVQQQIEAQEEYPVDHVWQEDYMLGELDGLLEHEVITDSEHVAIYANWIAKRRPDTTVLKVPPKPRGYGRGYMNE